MSHMNRGLFDPRRKMVLWPEPNDDPNIPYVWGLSGYPRSNAAPKTSIKVTPRPVPKNAPSAPNEYVRLAAGISLVLGVVGVYEGFKNSQETDTTAKVLDSLSTGVIYATGIGYVWKKMEG